ncbi:hypothetical protein [Dryocola clanedunensis]|uniref:hypothetical protein n=1 Tax=Cedecea sulfonylureivorans TaxID=3051154 RepID=UPI001929216F|nr:hypothetical protein [Cedecea sulfonylureivorans]
MAQPLSLAEYHDAVISSVKAHLPWVLSADTYPEENIPRYSGLVTPAVYFTLNNWSSQEGNEGQLNIELECDFFVVVDTASTQNISKPDIYLRAAAADLTQWVNGQQFGLTQLEPAVFTTSEKDDFDPRMDDYLVWRVSFTQAAAFGTDPFATTAGPLKAVWLGEAPDTGRRHIDDYTLIYEVTPDE